MDLTLLKNSMVVSLSATLVATACGLCVALWALGLSRNGARAVVILAIVSFCLPQFLVVGSWLDLFGLQGVLRSWLPWNIYSLSGTVWLLALVHWPIPMLLSYGAWRRLPPEQFEVDPALRGWNLFRHLLWPHARGAIALGAAVTFVLSLNNFAIPSILQTKVFPAELWVSFNTTFDYTAAIKLSVPLVIAPLLLWVAFRGADFQWPARVRSISPLVFRQQLQGHYLIGAVGMMVIALSVVLPLLVLLGSARTWTEFSGAMAAGGKAIWQSFFTAFVGATLTLAVGLMAWRSRVASVGWIVFLLPGVLMGVGLIWLLNRPGLGAIYQSIGVVLLALFLRYFALARAGARWAMKSMDSRPGEAARLSGASPWQILKEVQLPALAAPLAAAWYLVYLLCLWDVETLVLIIPPGAETIALRVFHLLHYGHNAQVSALCLILLLVALAPALGWMFLTAMKRRPAMATILSASCLLLVTGCQPPKMENVTPLEGELFSGVQIIGSRGTGAGQFNKPRSLAVDREDNLYVADMTGRIQKFSPKGDYILSWQMPQTDLGRPKGMCLDENGNIVVIEPHYSRINHFAPDGKLVYQWGNFGTNAGQIAFPRAAVITAKGEMFVSEYTKTERVQKFTSHGTNFLVEIGKAGQGDGEFNRPEGLGMDAAGRIYVADSCNHRIQVFSPDGKFVRAYGRAGSGRGELSYPYDVQVDAIGRQYVCEFGNSRIQIFDQRGATVEIIGGAGSMPGQLANPWSIAFDSQGNLYVADSQNHRVQKFIRRDSDRHTAKPVVGLLASNPGGER